MIKIGILSSHNGSGFDTIQEACKLGMLTAKIAVVVSNNSDAEVLKKASLKNVPHFVMNQKLFPDENLDEKMTELFKEYECNYIFLAGYMKKLESSLLHAFPNKIINSHPALLPKFGGVGMYGRNVHEAVIEAKEETSGCTIHFVNENYDEGEYILQNSITLSENETVESLEERIKKLESVTIVQALNRLFSK